MSLPLSAPLPERVAEAIRTQIIHGQFRPGERITEAQVATWLNVSNNPVREAFYLLEQQGLLVREPRRGTHVRTLDAEQVRDLYLVRAALEEIAYQLLIEKGALQPSDHDDLAKCIEQQAEASAAGDVARAIELDLQFHDSLYELAGSRILTDLWGGIRAQIRVLLYWRNLVADPDRQKAPPSLHRRILEHLRQGSLEQLVAENRQRNMHNSQEIMRVLTEKV